MIEIVGDFWQEIKRKASYDRYDAIVCTTNCVVKSDKTLVMGKGIASDFLKHFPWLAQTWGAKVNIKKPSVLVEDIRFCLDKTILWKYRVSFLVALPTKLYWQDSSTIDLVVQSCKQLEIITTALNWKSLLMTRPGCGCGGLQWHHIKSKLESILDDRFTIITKD